MARACARPRATVRAAVPSDLPGSGLALTPRVDVAHRLGTQCHSEPTNKQTLRMANRLCNAGCLAWPHIRNRLKVEAAAGVQKQGVTLLRISLLPILGRTPQHYRQDALVILRTASCGNVVVCKRCSSGPLRCLIEKPPPVLKPHFCGQLVICHHGPQHSPRPPPK